MGPTIRQIGTTNIFFADGHVKSLKPESFYYNKSWMLHPECDSATNAGNC